MIAFYRLLGLMALALGVIGAFLPVVPTVPFLLLAIFFFARSNPEWERRILDHPRYGPPLVAWRERGAIGRKAKAGAILGLSVSSVAGLLLVPSPWCFVPGCFCLASGAWILSRPS